MQMILAIFYDCFLTKNDGSLYQSLLFLEYLYIFNEKKNHVNKKFFYFLISLIHLMFTFYVCKHTFVVVACKSQERQTRTISSIYESIQNASSRLSRVSRDISRHLPITSLGGITKYVSTKPFCSFTHCTLLILVSILMFCTQEMSYNDSVLSVYIVDSRLNENILIKYRTQWQYCDIMYRSINNSRRK